MGLAENKGMFSPLPFVGLPRYQHHPSPVCDRKDFVLNFNGISSFHPSASSSYYHHHHHHHHHQTAERKEPAARPHVKDGGRLQRRSKIQQGPGKDAELTPRPRLPNARKARIAPWKPAQRQAFLSCGPRAARSSRSRNQSFVPAGPVCLIFAWPFHVKPRSHSRTDALRKSKEGGVGIPSEDPSVPSPREGPTPYRIAALSWTR
ncbi:forkhead box protein F2 [Crotalus adamanteus]|uniref:Forkhead box protein F2 n=1 Tax=Crotalus adamanteus TaxID=8729 RepID=A0AAW1BMY3_CROAD